MKRLTHKARYEAGYKLNRGLFTWQAIDRLAAYEDLGVTPEQIKEIDRLYAEKCREVVELKRRKWIPVDERLPEEPPEGLTDLDYLPEYIVMIHGADVPTTLHYAGDSEWCRDGVFYNVSAWMPLPEKYRPE